MKKLFLALFVFVSLFFVAACTPDSEETDRKIEGVVLADESPVSGAAVRIRNTSYEATTDNEGKFSFTITESKEEMSEFRLLVNHTGYAQATKDIVADDFKDGIASVTINLVSVNVTVSGVVSDGTSPLADVSVTIKGTSNQTTTNTSGEYTFNIERPQEITLVFEKEFFEVKEVVMNSFSSGNEFTQNATLSPLKVSFSGKVSNYYDGELSGVTVKIVGTNHETTTNASGEYSFSNLELENTDYQVAVSKAGYLDKVVASSETKDIEMIANYTDLGKIDGPTDIDAYVTKSSDGFYFKILLDEFRYQTGKEEKIQLFINPGDYTESSRTAGSHTVEFALTSNNGIIVVVSYLNGVQFISSIDWLVETIYTVGAENERVALYLYIAYDVFGKHIGADFAIDADSVVGLCLTHWSDFETTPASQWYREDMLGVDGESAVFHDNPEDWVRLAADGRSLYEGNDNKEHAKVSRTVSGVITDADNVPVANVTVAIPSLRLTTTTNDQGEYSLTIPIEKWAVTKMNIKVSGDSVLNYNKWILESDFVNNAAEIDMEVERVKETISVSGVVKAGNVGLEGVTVTVKGTTLSTTTNTDGEFAFSEAEHDVVPYVLVFTKAGYITVEVSINSSSVVLENPVVLNLVSSEPIDINMTGEYTVVGTVGIDNLEVSVAYESGKLKIKYVGEKAQLIMEKNSGN